MDASDSDFQLWALIIGVHLSELPEDRRAAWRALYDLHSKNADLMGRGPPIASRPMQLGTFRGVDRKKLSKERPAPRSAIHKKHLVTEPTTASTPTQANTHSPSWASYLQDGVASYTSYMRARVGTLFGNTGVRSSTTVENLTATS